MLSKCLTRLAIYATLQSESTIAYACRAYLFHRQFGATTSKMVKITAFTGFNPSIKGGDFDRYFAGRVAGFNFDRRFSNASIESVCFKVRPISSKPSIKRQRV